MRAWVVLLLVPLAGASPVGIENPEQPTAVTLYPHLLGRMDLPLNTQEPDDAWVYTDATGVVTHSQGCAVVPGAGIVSSTHHTVYGYAVPDRVDYRDGRPSFAPQRGIHADIRLDRDAGLAFTWYLAPASGPGVAAGAPLPSVSVAMTVREGDAISVEHSAMNTGRVVALGRSTPTAFAADATDSPDVTYADGIYEVRVPMHYADGSMTIPAETGFNIRIDVFVDVPGCNDPAGDRYLMPDWLRHHTSPGHRPRLEWTVLDPVQVRNVETQIDNGTLTLLAQIDTPWGPYNLGDPHIELTGDLEPRSSWLEQRDAAPYEPYLGRHVRWTWNFSADKAPGGQYAINLTVHDAQGNGPARALVPFAFGSQTTTCALRHDGEALCHTTEAGKESPMPLTPVFLLAALAILRRRGQ